MRPVTVQDSMQTVPTGRSGGGAFEVRVGSGNCGGTRFRSTAVVAIGWVCTADVMLRDSSGFLAIKLSKTSFVQAWSAARSNVVLCVAATTLM